MDLCSTRPDFNHKTRKCDFYCANETTVDCMTNSYALRVKEYCHMRVSLSFWRFFFFFEYYVRFNPEAGEFFIYWRHYIEYSSVRVILSIEIILLNGLQNVYSWAMYAASKINALLIFTYWICITVSRQYLFFVCFLLCFFLKQSICCFSKAIIVTLAQALFITSRHP